MKKARKIETSKQQALWVPKRLVDEFLKIAEVRGIYNSRSENSTVRDLLKELAIEESERLGLDIDENVIRYAHMGIK